MGKQHAPLDVLLSSTIILVVMILSLELLPLLSHSRMITTTNTIHTKSAVFLSPGFDLEPGSVSNKFYYDADFPTGHIAIKSFDAELVDDSGNSVPLHDTYFHHWLANRYRVRADIAGSEHLPSVRRNQSNFMDVRLDGFCQDSVLEQYFGHGSESRRTPSYIPDPYGIEVGDPADIPDGFVERWMINVHAIDMRGAVDRLGCTECLCDLYNVTEDEFGRAIPRDYVGGLSCCYDETRCRVRQGFRGAKRRLHMRYTVTWLDWSSDRVLPVKMYLMDVTDAWEALDDGTTRHNCQSEYVVEQSGSCDTDKFNCVHTKWNSVKFPRGGHVVYAVAHQHTAGIGSTLFGQDGRVICSSNPIYGNGDEAGNEAGYVVGMSTCYPEAGTVKIGDGETVSLKFEYNSSTRHTGVMGLYNIVLADQLPDPNNHSYLSLV